MKKWKSGIPSGCGICGTPILIEFHYAKLLPKYEHTAIVSGTPEKGNMWAILCRSCLGKCAYGLGKGIGYRFVQDRERGDWVEEKPKKGGTLYGYDGQTIH